ncbi:MAG: glutamine--tRNA ligase [Candidatus Marinimicrobia bacterium]|nr:glutamine--tRNA ligase [Candidatus Neomarinimicrobiota bacterium]|tara:strand:+ start:111810 stop:113444 length:1635 start_codon:yes stop_codon:yes gene_type:complete
MTELLNNFITDIIDDDIKNNKSKSFINTRFPPEPNGYLHIGHAKSIFLNYGIAKQYKGSCNLRFDDTNPTKESMDYINSIIDDVKWLVGIKNIGKILYASDYFDRMYELAIELINQNLAYVDDQNIDDIKKNRGDYNIQGIESPYRNRSIEENIKLFKNMKNGMYQDGEKVLRAKIDMNAKNINLRDPIMYRILHAHHPRTGNEWCIYPMYDWAHGIEDSIEKITHSICTLEFEDHRPLYDWFLEKLKIHHPKQIEFAKLSMTYTLFSKRNLLKLVDNNIVDGWDDPRMPTISGLRRRGYTAKAIKNFVLSLGVAKREAISDFNHLEYYLREDLNSISYRKMVVLDPVKLIIENYNEEESEFLEAENNPENSSYGSRMIPFSKELYIERNDFMENAPKKFFRLSVGREVRLKHAYYITCTGFKTDETGKLVEITCTYDPSTKGGWSNDGRKVRGTIHWVSAKDCLNAEIRIYNRLFNIERPTLDNIHLDSKTIITNAKIEPSLVEVDFNQKYQFLRLGYFVFDKESNENNLIFNQSVALRNNWK